MTGVVAAPRAKVSTTGSKDCDVLELRLGSDVINGRPAPAEIEPVPSDEGRNICASGHVWLQC